MKAPGRTTKLQSSGRAGPVQRASIGIRKDVISQSLARAFLLTTVSRAFPPSLLLYSQYYWPQRQTPHERPPESLQATRKLLSLSTAQS